MSELKKRNLAIDLIKMCAIFGVLVIHAGSGVLTQNAVGSHAWVGGLFWGALFRASVPLFLMASGAVMLDCSKKLSLKKLYFRNIARIVVAMLVWGIGYKLYHLCQTGQMNIPMFWYSIKRLLLFDQEFHFYYIHMILIVYVFLPVTRTFCEKADKKSLIYAICVWAVLGIIYPTVKTFKPFSLLSGLTGQWAINLTFASIGYGILGYYLKEYPLSRATAIGCFCLGFAITFGMTFYSSYNDGALNELYLQGTGPGVCLLAVGIFSLAFYIDIKGSFAKLVTYISKASFCIYLSHMFILYGLEKIGVTAQILLAIVSVPLVSVCVLLVCLVIYWILSKIPVLNKWII